MPYIGNQPADRFGSLAYQDLTGVTGSPVKRGFTLNQAVANEMELEVFVNKRPLFFTHALIVRVVQDIAQKL